MISRSLSSSPKKSVFSLLVLDLKRARLVESSLLTGFVMVSLPFVPGFPEGAFPRAVAILFVASALLFSSIYSFNSYWGFTADRLNPRLTQYESPGYYPLRGVVSLAISLPLFYGLRPELVWLAALIVALWTAYSIPGGAKARPIWGTAVHFFAQILHFHLGVVALSRPSPATLGASVFFALLFAGGHLVHEVKDAESDRRSGIRTNAVAWGSARTVMIYRALTLMTAAYWLGIYELGLIQPRIFRAFFLAALAHLVAASIWKSPSLATASGNHRFQLTYRLFYLAAGCATFVQL